MATETLESDFVASKVIRLNPILQDILSENQFTLAMLQALLEHSSWTLHHVFSVAHITCLLANFFNPTREDLILASGGGLFHDIGKLTVPSKILNEDSITPCAKKIIETHPQVGYKILQELNPSWAIIALTHHQGQHNDLHQCQLGGRLEQMGSLVSLADFTDALLSSERPYKEAWPEEKALGVMQNAYKNSWAGPYIPYAIDAFFALHGR